MAFGRSKKPGRLRVLTAAARRVDLKDKTEVRRVRAVLQGWQADAWNYLDSVGELHYAVDFKANSMARMRLFVGVEPEMGEDIKPIPLEDSDIPEQFKATASQALSDLATGEGDRREMLKKLSTSVDIPGECRILGRTDPETGEETWSIRSTDEIEFRDDATYMREIPDGPQGVIPWVPLDPDLNVVSRVWVPHPRFELMADSPMKPLVGQCETLLLLRRMDRAELRSRLNRGLLGVPEELSIKVPEDDNEDPQADPFMSNLAQAITEPISDEGVASAYAPIVIRGPADVLKALTHIDLTRPFDEQAMRKEERIVGNIATGIDLPKEVVTGIADLNHWSAWQVDDNTFRHHLEPHAIKLVDMLTAGYFRPRLLADGVPEQYARRLVIWYDPTELVTHPDRTSDATKLYELHALSAEAMVKAAGFTEEDMPGAVEIMIRMLQNMRTPPPNMVMAAMHELDPNLTIPPITVAGTIPGVKPSGVDPGEAVEAPALTGTPQAQLPVASVEGPPAVDAEPIQGPPAITASGADTHRLSRKLSQIDRDLRTRLQVAANAAMLRQLERMGSRVRTKVAKNETMRTKIAHRPNERVTAILGKEALIAAGITPGLDDWNGLRQQFMDWTETAQKQALEVAVRIGTYASESDAIKVAEAGQILGREKAWTWLSEALDHLGEHLTYAPDPNVGPTDFGDLNPDTIVPTGMIRGALGIAGGGETTQIGTDLGAALSEPGGQIGTGATISELLEGGGAETDQYEWEHGNALNPFEPHAELDGLQFTSFTDERLANNGDFPANSYFFPGDHSGCSCFPAGTVVSGPVAVAATKRWYSGDLVEIVTATGRKLAGTPNHPILTPYGWVALGLLQEGDDVVGSGGSESMTSLIGPNEHHDPTLIEDVASALDGAGAVSSIGVPGSAVDFHGDGMDSKVHVVGTNGSLGSDGDAAFQQPSGEQSLIGRSEATPALAGKCGTSVGVGRVGASTLGGMGGSSFGTSCLGGQRGDVQPNALTDIASPDSSLDESLADSATVDAEALGNSVLGFPSHVSADIGGGQLNTPMGLLEESRLADSGALVGSAVGDSFDGSTATERDACLAATQERPLNKNSTQAVRVDSPPLSADDKRSVGKIVADRVLKVLRRSWSGHVYNLQTKQGWYSANGIVVHNCDVTPLWVNTGEAQSDEPQEESE